jgi:hypothetical protein
LDIIEVVGNHSRLNDQITRRNDFPRP